MKDPGLLMREKGRKKRKMLPICPEWIKFTELLIGGGLREK